MVYGGLLLAITAVNKEANIKQDYTPVLLCLTPCYNTLPLHSFDAFIELKSSRPTSQKSGNAMNDQKVPSTLMTDDQKISTIHMITQLLRLTQCPQVTSAPTQELTVKPPVIVHDGNLSHNQLLFYLQCQRMFQS